jgi:nucleotide-binding universal stress UspA family protein
MSAPSLDKPPVGPIVVGIDGSPSSEQALRWAADQARLTGQQLHAVTSWDFPVPYDVPVTGEFDWGGDAAEVLAKTVGSVLGEPDAGRVVQRAVQGRPAKVLINAARDAGLLVVGSRGHGGFTGLLLGSVSQHVIAHASCPVVVVHEHRSHTGRIVVGVDGSPESERALRWAAEQARMTDRELHAVISWHVPVDYGSPCAPKSTGPHTAAGPSPPPSRAHSMSRTPRGWCGRSSRTTRPARCCAPRRTPTCSWSAAEAAAASPACRSAR